MVRIHGFHPWEPRSILGLGDFFYNFLLIIITDLIYEKIIIKNWKNFMKNLINLF